MKTNITGILNKLRTEEKKIRMILIIFFTVGIAGFALPVTSNFFTHLTPFALLLSISALAVFHKTDRYKKSLLIFSLISIAGFLTEAVGVRSGMIFGAYSYGAGLGLKLLDTPLMIGINWLFLVYCTSIIVNPLPVTYIFKIIPAALLMIVYDVLLEQTAPILDMWEFAGGSAPFKNYISWFIISMIFLLFLRLTGIRFENRIAPFIFVLQLVFFAALLIIFKLLQ
jgi:putative membrane protein